MKRIKVLYIHGDIMRFGGTESYMMNYYRNIDKSKIQIDFVVHGFEKGVYDDEIISNGSKIYNIPLKSKDYFGNIKAIKSIFKTEKYNIVHSHMDAMGFVPLKLAKKYNIPVRIAHSHNTQHQTNSKLKLLLNEYARKNITKYATHLFACSEKAGRWLFGDNSFDNGRVEIIYNAIDFGKFKFDNKKRDYLRQSMNLEDNFVIGHIGRFDYQKNHDFILRLFRKVIEKIPSAKLVLIGDGHLRKNIENMIIDMNLENKVIILGNRTDVNKLYNMFDMFILPSLFEGLPIVGIEAQINGLCCLFSKSISPEVKITNNVCFESLDSSIDVWVNKLVSIYNDLGITRKRNNIDYKSNLCQKYDINMSSKHFENRYITLFNNTLKDG